MALELALAAALAAATPTPRALLDFSAPKTEEDRQANRRVYRHVATIVHDLGDSALNKDPRCFVRQKKFGGLVYVLYRPGEMESQSRIELGSGEFDDQYSFLIRHYSRLKKDFLMATFTPFDHVVMTFVDVGCAGNVALWKRDFLAGDKEPIELPPSAAEPFVSKYNFEAFRMLFFYRDSFPLPREYPL